VDVTLRCRGARPATPQPISRKRCMHVPSKGKSLREKTNIYVFLCIISTGPRESEHFCITSDLLCFECAQLCGFEPVHTTLL
jgi:hypothetical protein